MTEEIAELLKSKNIIIDKVLLRAVYFSPEYSKAIEQKVIAEQRVKQAEFEVKETTQRAQAKIAEAKGLAEAKIKDAMAEALKKFNDAATTIEKTRATVEVQKAFAEAYSKIAESCSEYFSSSSKYKGKLANLATFLT